MESPLISEPTEWRARYTSPAVSELIPGYEYTSRAEELWALVVENLAGWEERAGAAAADVGLSPVSAWALVQLEPASPISERPGVSVRNTVPSTPSRE